MFAFPRKVFANIALHPGWEFMVLYLKQEFDNRSERSPVGATFCCNNMNHTYVPSFIGMDYNYTLGIPVYRQMLFQTIRKRCTKERGFTKIDFSMTAAFEKRKKSGQLLFRKWLTVKDDDNLRQLIGV